MNDKNKKNEQDREELGYGYEKSLDDLKVIGQNNQDKKNEKKEQKDKKK